MTGGRDSDGISMGTLSGSSIAFTIRSVDRSLSIRLRDLYGGSSG